MLTIKKPYIRLPASLFVHTGTMQLSPVVSDNDELTSQIDNRAATDDDLWQLDPAIDSEELERNWAHVQSDIEKDPSWFTFDDE
ncbi:hypothetical protein CR983_03035 [Candidatus Saccharibacteria bacterium]|nr:MAG: hypothetical protein CR983_03035 [Candidatus Saccharibacteria bacterium]